MNKSIVEEDDIIGRWEVIQEGKVNRVSLKDIVVDCEEGTYGVLYTFDIGDTFSQKSICPNGKPTKKGTWVYRDNILSLTMEGDNVKFSVSDAGKNKIKLSSLLVNIEGSVLDKFDNGFYIILEKQ
ncbi:hypothetical protein DVK85_07060 [Flavobacterium arcticum]|uniref:Lipocalin-like domain-containing protein n=1 Tax=Flavobacterium arcticum TaxID=1784713 RepID=A0A345HBQ5_9FLAO|nr:hypothetical protein [Flavobacterium arcticum]AXG74015.1 hypothetical protein DVK85_07060 [Flavobacterium arcticum]KAF2508993.1 hypothetical protein E0W72_10545 [Flavobacterium arcticum]